jgi:hypothetical protein
MYFIGLGAEKGRVANENHVIIGCHIGLARKNSENIHLSISLFSSQSAASVTQAGGEQEFQSLSSGSCQVQNCRIDYSFAFLVGEVNGAG